MYIKTYVEDLGLNSGDTYRGTCPTCRGTNTFTASNVDGLLVWNCYKNSCNIRGRFQGKLSVNDIHLKLNKVSISDSQEFVKPTFVRPLDPTHSAYGAAYQWGKGWGIDIEGYLYDYREHRVVFPIYNKGLLVDAAGRTIGYKTNTKPKWKRYGNSKLPYTCGVGKVAVVVEDCISASVVGGNGKVGVAILGTSLAPEHVATLSTFDRIIVALDPDARNKTLAYTKELRRVAPEVYALNLKDDLKYRNPIDLEKLEDLVWKKSC